MSPAEQWAKAHTPPTYADLEAQVAALEGDNRDTVSGYARLVRELRARLGLDHAPDLNLPSDEVTPLKEKVAALEAERDTLQVIVTGYDEWLSNGVYFTTTEYTDLLAEHDQQLVKVKTALDALEAENKTLKEDVEVGLQLTGSFFEALKPLKLTHIYAENPGQHITDFIAERDAQQARAEIAIEALGFIANQTDKAGNWAVELAHAALKALPPLKPTPSTQEEHEKPIMYGSGDQIPS